MPVNNFEFEKADGIISSIKGQSVGRDPISAAGIFNFVSIAQKGFGYEPEEVNMVKLIKPASFESPILLFDTKLSEVVDIINDGGFVYLWDDHDYILDNASPRFYFITRVRLVDDEVNQIAISTLDNDNSVVTFYIGADADGYLYYYFD